MYFEKYIKYKQKYLQAAQAVQEAAPGLTSVRTNNQVDCWLDTALYLIFGNVELRTYMFARLNPDIVTVIQAYLSKSDINKDDEKRAIVDLLNPSMTEELTIYNSGKLSIDSAGSSTIVTLLFKIPFLHSIQGISPEVFAIDRQRTKDSWDSIKEIIVNTDTYKLVSFQLATIGAAGVMAAYEHEIAFFASGDKWMVMDNEDTLKEASLNSQGCPIYQQMGLYAKYGEWNFSTCSSLAIYMKV